MLRVVHFKIAGNNPEQLAAFYAIVFGWEITKWPGPQDYWLVKTGPAGTPGIDGAIFRPMEHFVGAVNSIAVEDIDATVAKIRASGGQTVSEKSTIPGIGY
jgi:hypothetical protein